MEERADGGGGDAQQENAVGIDCKPVGEGDVAEQIVGNAAIGVPDAVDNRSRLDRVAAAEPAHLVLELEYIILEAGTPPDLLREVGDAEAAPVELRNPLDVRKIGGQTLEAE